MRKAVSSAPHTAFAASNVIARIGRALRELAVMPLPWVTTLRSISMGRPPASTATVACTIHGGDEIRTE